MLGTDTKGREAQMVRVETVLGHPAEVERTGVDRHQARARSEGDQWVGPLVLDVVALARAVLGLGFAAPAQTAST